MPSGASAGCSWSARGGRRRPDTARASCTARGSCTRAARRSAYTFGQLIDAQAAGDFAAIESHDLPILRVHLGADVEAGLAALEQAIIAAFDHTSEG